MHYILVIVMGLALIASPAFAAGAKKKGGGSKSSNQYQANWEEKEKKSTKDSIDTKKIGQAVDIPMVILPLIERGRLSNYAYVSIRINLKDGQDAWAIRGKSHFLKDAIIRKTHNKQTALLEVQNANDSGLNEDDLEAIIQSAIKPWVPKSSINSIEFLKIDMQR